MNKYLIPTYIANNVFEVDYNLLKEKGYINILFDLDNTLASPYDFDPNDKVKNLINNLKLNGFNIIILSNNKKEGVERFTKPLNVKAFYKLKKPSIKKVKRYLDNENICFENTIILGDQVMTDVNMANHLKIDVILLKPLTLKDEPITFIPRLLDKFFRNKIYKKKLAKEL